VEKVLEMLKEHSVEYVDLRFTDPRGKWQHTAQHVSTIDEDVFRDGIMFDGSSIAGWKAINESDMILMLDPETAVMDPFAAKPSLIVFCDIIEPSTGQSYSRDPRSTAKKAEAYVKASGIGDAVFFGPEAEFFIFDSVKFGTGGNYGIYQIDSQEGPQASLKDYPEGNMGHRPVVKGGYFPVPPVDSESDLRAEMLSTMGEMGVEIEKHHHEVAQSQHELGMKFGAMTRIADHLQIYKYCIHNVAHSYGKTATFMPKPIYGDNGSGMHCHPATNSYKRLIPGFEAPVLLAYSARNRSAACRIPYATNPKAKRVEVRFPDAAANPYLAFSAMLMAGLDGIRNKIHPGDPMDKDLYDLPPEELKGIPTVCGSLREALGALVADHEFLLAGDVFSMDQIESYIELKWSEVYRFEHTPHPVEFEMYYSV
jgi:glutamine synthetase